MDESLIDDIPQVSDEENAHLIASYIEKEVKRAFFEMEHNKSASKLSSTRNSRRSLSWTC
jgi:hypothetical protein